MTRVSSAGAHSAPSTAALMILRDLRLQVARQSSRDFGPFDLVLQRGDQVAILGPSGAGKSTLLKAMAGDERVIASQGSVVFQGQVLSAWSHQALACRRAVLPQSHGVAFGLSVELVVSLGRVARLVDPHLSGIVREALGMAKASHLLHRRFDTLSGGEQARVQLARVFAQLWDERDGLLLVDEPLAALDPGLQFELIEAMQTYTRSRGHALVAVLHDINHALQSFERLWLIRDRKLESDLLPDTQAIGALAALYGVHLEPVTVVGQRGAVVVCRAPLGGM